MAKPLSLLNVEDEREQNLEFLKIVTETLEEVEVEKARKRTAEEELRIHFQTGFYSGALAMLRQMSLKTGPVSWEE